MNSIIFFGLFAILGGFYMARHQLRLHDWVSPTIISGALGCVVGSVVAIGINTTLARSEITEQVTNLVSMRTTEGLSGSFILGGGGVNSRTVYKFLKKNDDGSFTPGEISANYLVRIYEEESLHDSGYKQTVYSVIDDASPWANWALTSKRIVRHEFHVPKGSVRQGFSVE